MSILTFEQIIQKRAKSFCQHGNIGSCSTVSRTGTTMSGLPASVYITDIIANSDQDYSLIALNGTAFLMNFSLNADEPFIAHFNSYPHTNEGTSLKVLVDSVGGTNSLAVLGFDH